MEQIPLLAVVTQRWQRQVSLTSPLTDLRYTTERIGSFLQQVVKPWMNGGYACAERHGDPWVVPGEHLGSLDLRLCY